MTENISRVAEIIARQESFSSSASKLFHLICEFFEISSVGTGALRQTLHLCENDPTRKKIQILNNQNESNILEYYPELV